MDGAVIRGHIQHNPCHNIKHKRNGHNKAGHFRAVHHTEIAGVLDTIKRCKAREITKQLFEFQLLTAVRPSEARLAEWKEIDFTTATWNIPGDKMKMGEAFRVPLSNRAVALLHEIASTTHEDAPRLIFSCYGVPLNRTLINDLLEDNKINSTGHGLRSTFRGFCSDKGVPFDLAEKALSHIANKTIRAYDRGDALEPRRSHMQAWENYLTKGEGRE